MRILQIHKYYWPRDGASKYMLALEQLLTDAGHEVIPFAMQQEQTLETPYSKYFVSEMELNNPKNTSVVQKIRAAFRMIYNREARKKIAQLLDDEQIDVVHLHNIYHHISPSILLEVKKRNIPIVMSLHDYKLLTPNYTMFHHGAVHEEDAHGWYLSCVGNKCMKDSRAQSLIVTLEMIIHHKIFKWYERYIDLFIAPSRFMQDLCVRFGWPEEKFQHIVHPQQREEGGDTSGEYVAFLGRLSSEKGVETLIRAAAQTPNIPYRIAGDGPERERLEQLAKELGATHVQFDGFLSGSAIEQFVAKARFVVVPSIWYENYPLAILESKAAGRVVLGSRIGGIPELLPDELLFEPGDVAGLAKRIDMWYSKPLSEIAAVGKTLQQQVRQENDPEAHVQAIIACYASLL